MNWCFNKSQKVNLISKYTFCTSDDYKFNLKVFTILNTKRFDLKITHIFHIETLKTFKIGANPDLGATNTVTK